MKPSRLFTFVVALTLAGSVTNVQPAQAGDCFSDPIYDHDWTGTVTTGAFVRDVACMEGSTVISTLALGSTIAVTGETDGWWRVELSDGTTGWVGDWLLSVTESPVTNPTPTVVQTSLSATAAAGIRSRATGYILLQVEDHGEAWYVDPLTGNRYYMKDGPTAYEMMRTFGLGMTEADYLQLAAGDNALTDRLLGRIVLRVQAHGEAYYVHPDGSVYYLADGPAAYALMREHSLGITNLDLTAITEAELELIPYDDEAPATEVLGVADEAITVSQYQAGELPEAFEIAALSDTWLAMVNAERTERGAQPLELDQVLTDTTANWAAYMGATGNFTHTRPYGESLLAWVQGFNYPSHDFGENLALVFADNSSDGLEQVLIDAMAMFMSEESYNGMHYQNVIDPDWETTGVGFFFDAFDNESYRVYAVFHFASLE